MSNKNLLKPSNDVIFKRLFGEKGNERIIKDLLEAILEIKIDRVELAKEVEITPEKIEEKIGVLDVLVHLPDGTLVDVEMQNYNQNNIEKRMTFYTSRLYSEGIKEGQKYKKLSKIIGIAILNFDYFKDIPSYHTKWQMREQTEKEKMLDEQELHFIELPKFMKTEKNIERKIDQWLLFLDNREKELIEMAKEKNEVVREAAEKYEYLTGDEEVQRLAFLKMKYELDRIAILETAREEGLEEGREQGKAEGRAEGMKVGMEEGIKEGELMNKLENAKRMLELGSDDIFVEKVTGLSKEEIQKIKDDIKNKE